jgi:transcription-repair coupling factor (superfamily II helicase)
VTPVELDPEAAAHLRDAVADSVYEPGRSQLTVRVGEDAAQAFPAVVRAADALLAATAEPARTAA